MINCVYSKARQKEYSKKHLLMGSFLLSQEVKNTLKVQGCSRLKVTPWPVGLISILIMSPWPLRESCIVKRRSVIEP